MSFTPHVQLLYNTVRMNILYFDLEINLQVHILLLEQQNRKTEVILDPYNF